MNPFLPRHEDDVLRLITDYPLAWVVSMGAAGGGATPLPLLAETDAEGRIEALLGHFARSNPQVALLERQPEAMILFQGPQGYIPPRLVSNPIWGPTWNYVVARFDVEVRFVPEETDAAVEKLAAALERDRPEPWTPERMGARRAELAKRIIAFRARVIAAHPRFKLGQDEATQTFDEIVTGLDDATLAAWMTQTVRG
ncbi:MAG TPA: FMN-binding negative transcriptional regulator [Sphingomonas sp.]|nr:FMN-binding negative transcriptional regulator [Sphingomonas sp.]